MQSIKTNGQTGCIIETQAIQKKLHFSREKHLSGVRLKSIISKNLGKKSVISKI